ncbi:hypothetical protein DVH24_002072 [Malus domestica]|uniref:Uncharacterized protein n=1 Tax=Malus domestica TaxID=3750 RepID=A0A498I8P8_MALDO|nr:hypothetical protein DVH24_002072 [Malus domestica]
MIFMEPQQVIIMTSQSNNALSCIKFEASRNGFMGHECSTTTTCFKNENVTAPPPSVNWRKNQGQCGLI